MGFYEHATEFAGLPVVDWDPEAGIVDPTGTIYRLGLSWDEGEEGVRWTDKFATFLDDPAVGSITGLVVGPWTAMLGAGEEDASASVVEALVAARDRLPHLKAIFLGDVISEECEISWIPLTDVSPLFHAYPALEHFTVRGTEGLSLGELRHDSLRSLVIQSGGLSRDIFHQVAMAELPELTHLELWLGTGDYGGNVTVEDLAPLLPGTLFPRLHYLGLRDSEIADEIAAVVAQAPVVEKIRVLDLSMGTLGDEGAAALLASPAVARLEKLDIHHHYCSPTMLERLKGLGIEVDAGDPQDESRFGRYVAVGE
jgi:hypothetical protein